MPETNDYRCRWSPTLGALEDTAENIWGIQPYKAEKDKEKPTVFFGLYGLPDFWALWRHQGKKWILWAGSDITHFTNGYWLEEGGGIRVAPEPLAEWINKYCESWVENEVEREALERIGITAQVGPSFLGDVSLYENTYHSAARPDVYLSANRGREIEYGWGIVEDIAPLCDVDFHLYGSPDWKTEHSNVYVHGRVPKHQMNMETQKMQAGLRLNLEMDGFSEILAKAVLCGQYAIAPESYKYPHLIGFRSIHHLINELNRLKNKEGPKGVREYYQRTLNSYPWNLNK